MVAPYAIGIVALVVVPAIITFGLAFTDDNLIQPPEFVGAKNFTGLAHDPVFWIALRNSLVYAAITTPLRILGALGLALLLHRRRRGWASRVPVPPSVVPDSLRPAVAVVVQPALRAHQPAPVGGAPKPSGSASRPRP
jgi:multiple sugar transport system permease protein